MARVQWILDPTHSEIQFKIRHLMIANVSGQFTKYSLDANTENDDFMTAKVKFSAEIDSVNTGNEQRDGNLKSPDFFDATKYP
jgi:polyisoprenoid-binding protein YceI